MNTDLILTAQTWQLADDLESSPRHGGVFVLRHTATRTYLTLTPAQWVVLQQFRAPRTVPQVLEHIIEERQCPVLGEFYELVLKAVRAGVLVEPGDSTLGYPALNWPLRLRPEKMRVFVWALLLTGLGFAAGFRPGRPETGGDIFAGLVALAVGLLGGGALAASLLRGAGGEIYGTHRWFLSNEDACMLDPRDQRTIALGSLAVLAAVTGWLAWHHPAWSLVPLLGLLLRLRPFGGGVVNRLLRLGAERRWSDAEHDFLFPANRSARTRAALIGRSLRQRTTWLEIGYAALWTVLVSYFAGRFTDVPPWRLAFWEMHGLRLALALGGSLALLGLAYAAWEGWRVARRAAVDRHISFRRCFGRWFRRDHVATDEAARAEAIGRTLLLRQLAPPARLALARAMTPERVGAWQVLHEFDQPVDRVSVILSGRVGVYRRSRSGRRELVQVLDENQLVGLHAVGDPRHPQFLYRSLTPLVLASVDWQAAREHILNRFPAAVIGVLVHRAPFLAGTDLCRSWHVQTIQRFAELAQVKDYEDGDVILAEGHYSDSFYIVLEGRARVLSRNRVVGHVGRGSFFGEIGLLQNSSATAQVLAGPGTRCLCVPRREFLRFVAHNHAVALRLERVSSQRLGRPIFPLSPGNFRTI